MRRSVIAFAFEAGVEMKLAVGIIVFIWLLCGLVGDWIIDGRDDLHFKPIIYGPITLADALNDHPMSYPGPD